MRWRRRSASWLSRSSARAVQAAALCSIRQRHGSPSDASARARSAAAWMRQPSGVSSGRLFARTSLPAGRTRGAERAASLPRLLIGMGGLIPVGPAPPDLVTVEFRKGRVRVPACIAPREVRAHTRNLLSLIKKIEIHPIAPACKREPVGLSATQRLRYGLGSARDDLQIAPIAAQVAPNRPW